MPIELQWIQRPSILGMDHTGNITAEEIEQACNEALRFAERRRLYLVVNLTNVISLPRNLLNIVFHKEGVARFMQHPNVRAFAYVGVNATTRLSLESALRGKTAQFFDDTDSALVFLRERVDQDEQVSK